MSEQFREQLQMLQQKFGFDRPYVTPAQSMTGALEGFSRAVSNRSVKSVEIGANRKYKDGITIYVPLITFSRSGDQEFADDRAVWWDSPF